MKHDLSLCFKQLYEYERGLTPPDLTDAHDANDKAVFAAYAYLGIRPNMSDEEIAMILLRESVRLAKLADNKKRTRRVSKRKNINQK